MKKQILLLTIALTSLSSCGIYKSYERPVDLQTDGLYGAVQTGNAPQGTGAMHWREFFTDPTLQALIQKALAQNTSMKQTDLQILEAQEYLKCSKLAYIPSLVFSPQGQLSSFDWAAPNKTYSLPITASWQLGSFGQLRNSKKSAEVTVEQTKVVRMAVQQSLVANVANLYYTLCMLDAELAITEQTAENWKQSVELTKNLMQAGRSNKAACTILGEAPHHIERTSLNAFQAPSVQTGLPLALLQNRPDVRQAELKLANSFYNVNLAKAAFYPSLTISGTLGFTNSGGGIIVNPGKFIWNALGQLTQPLFANGALRAKKKVAEMQMEEAKMAFQQSLIAAGNEVNTALATLQKTTGKQDLISAQITALSDALQATEALYRDNVSRSVNYLNVLTAQTGLLSAQLGQISNQFATVQATINLYQALGGGSITEQ